MVVKFAIEPDALIDGSYDSPRDMIGQHKRLIRLWEQYGILVDPSEGPDSITSKFDNEELRKVRTVWQEAWKAKRLCRRVRPEKGHHVRWKTLNSPSDVAAYEQLIEVALVEAVRGIAYLGIPEEDSEGQGDNLYSTYCGSVEAALFRYPEQSHTFASIMELSQRTVMPAQQSRSYIWSTWFENLAQKSREVVIIDRYGFSRRNFNGMCWTLQFLTEGMTDGVVAIYASNPSTLDGLTVSEPDIVNRIRTVLARNPRNLKSVMLFLMVDQEMTRDRYIRFDECAFSIGHGVSEAFKDERLAEDMPCLLDAQPRGVVRTMRNEVQRLMGRPHKRLRFEHGFLVTSEDVVL